jgi:hypothetical protein
MLRCSTVRRGCRPERFAFFSPMNNVMGLVLGSLPAPFCQSGRKFRLFGASTLPGGKERQGRRVFAATWRPSSADAWGGTRNPGGDIGLPSALPSPSGCPDCARREFADDAPASGTVPLAWLADRRVPPRYGGRASARYLPR